MSATAKFSFYAFCLTLSAIAWRAAAPQRELAVSVPDPAGFAELGYTFRDDGTRTGRFLCHQPSHRCLQLDERGVARALYVAHPGTPVGVFRRYTISGGHADFAGFTVRQRTPEGPLRHFQDFDPAGHALGPLYHFQQTTSSPWDAAG